MKSRSAGFTVIELLMYIGIVSLMFVVFMSFIVDVTRQASRTRARADLQQNAQLVMARLAQDIRSAQTVVIPSAGRVEMTFSASPSKAYSFSGSTVDVEQPIGSPTVVLTTASIDVTNLQFTQDATTQAISIGLTVQPKNPTTVGDTVNMATTVVPRIFLY
jgi:type II secretory pathway pseudopilin PulG